MLPYDIYEAKYSFNECEDSRPWLIVDERKGELWGCFPISGQCYVGPSFPINCEHESFSETGLRKNCFILDESIYTLNKSHFGKHRGRLAGTLLESFLDYSGLPPLAENL